MEKLTIKELAPYLPYELQWVFEGSDDVHEVVGLDITDFGVHIISPYGDSGRCSIKEGKPLLRPLSQLIEEIHHNGEKFVPMVELEKIRKDIEIYRPLNLHYPLEINIQTEDYSQEIDLHDGYLIMQKLLEWHFDVFRLHEKNLALPIDGKEVKS